MQNITITKDEMEYLKNKIEHHFPDSLPRQWNINQNNYKKLAILFRERSESKCGVAFLVKIFGPYAKEKETVRTYFLDSIYISLFKQTRDEKLNELLRPMFFQDSLITDTICDKDTCLEAIDLCDKTKGKEIPLRKLIESILFIKKLKTK